MRGSQRVASCSPSRSIHYIRSYCSEWVCSYSSISRSFMRYSSSFIAASFRAASVRMSFRNRKPNNKSRAANTRTTVSTIFLMAFPRVSGEDRLLKTLVGTLDSMKLPMDLLACLLNSMNFLKISALREQKLASAIAAKPN